MPTHDKSFMDYVQDHERSWGNETYQGRPNLAELIQSPVVVFWEVLKSEKNIKEVPPYTVSLHKSLSEVEHYFAKILVRAQVEAPKQRIYRIFANGKEVRIKKVTIEFE
jgi:hypothetical protein